MCLGTWPEVLRALVFQMSTSLGGRGGFSESSGVSWVCLRSSALLSESWIIYGAGGSCLLSHCLQESSGSFVHSNVFKKRLGHHLGGWDRRTINLRPVWVAQQDRVSTTTEKRLDKVWCNLTGWIGAWDVSSEFMKKRVMRTVKRKSVPV
jgi:hypothetical protein